jgi:hypothetical protein
VQGPARDTHQEHPGLKFVQKPLYQYFAFHPRTLLEYKAAEVGGQQFVGVRLE